MGAVKAMTDYLLEIGIRYTVSISSGRIEGGAIDKEIDDALCLLKMGLNLKTEVYSLNIIGSGDMYDWALSEPFFSKVLEKIRKPLTDASIDYVMASCKEERRPLCLNLVVTKYGVSTVNWIPNRRAKVRKIVGGTLPTQEVQISRSAISRLGNKVVGTIRRKTSK